jgi:UDP-galactopyranose mutase
MLEIRNMSAGDLFKPKHARLVVDLELPPWVDVVAFSSTNWEDAHERPRQLMTRCANTHRVFFFQEAKFDACEDPYLELSTKDRVHLVTPHLRPGDSSPARNKEKLIGLLLSLAEIHQYIFWYFSPIAIESTGTFIPRCVVYDYMNEPAELRKAFSNRYESCKQKLTSRADLIFTTDLNMCLNSSNLITNVHLFADATDPKNADWDKLWNQMSRLIHRYFGGIPPLKELDSRL